MTMERNSAPLFRPVDRTPIAPAFASAASMFLVTMDTLVVNLALPDIQSRFGAAMWEQQWIIDGYTIALAALLLLAGNLTDRWGTQKAFASGVAIFCLSSILCALSTSSSTLIFGRALMGAGAALILPSSMSIINQGYTAEHSRKVALAAWGIGGSAATAFGPVLGGCLVPISWRLVFAINIPPCLLLLLLCTRIVPRKNTDTPIDMEEQLLSLTGLTCIVGGIIALGTGDHVAPSIALVASGLTIFSCFIRRQHISSAPSVPPDLVRNPGIRLSLLGGFIIILNWNGLVFLCTLYLQQVLNLSPLEAGMTFMYGAIASVIGNLGGERISVKFGAQRTLLLGSLCLIACHLLLLVAGIGFLSPLHIACAICLSGLGGAITTPCLAETVLSHAPSKESGIASALFNTMRQIGGAVGIAVFGSIVSTSPALQQGLTRCFFISLAATCYFAWKVLRSRDVLDPAAEAEMGSSILVRCERASIMRKFFHTR